MGGEKCVQKRIAACLPRPPVWYRHDQTRRIGERDKSVRHHQYLCAASRRLCNPSSNFVYNLLAQAKQYKRFFQI